MFDYTRDNILQHMLQEALKLYSTCVGVQADIAFLKVYASELDTESYVQVSDNIKGHILELISMLNKDGNRNE